MVLISDVLLPKEKSGDIQTVSHSSGNSELHNVAIVANSFNLN